MRGSLLSPPLPGRRLIAEGAREGTHGGEECLFRSDDAACSFGAQASSAVLANVMDNTQLRNWMEENNWGGNMATDGGGLQGDAD